MSKKTHLDEEERGKDLRDEVLGGSMNEGQEDLESAVDAAEPVAVEGVEPVAEGEASEVAASGAELTPEMEKEWDEEAVETGAADEAGRIQEILDLTNDLQRTRADFENFRRRAEERQEAAKQSARLATVYKLLPLLDDLDRAISTYEELAPLAKSLEKTLNDLELKVVSAKPGEEFNPDIHDAVSVEGEGEKEVVGEVLREGYYYEGELLRPAMVKVRRED